MATLRHAAELTLTSLPPVGDILHMPARPSARLQHLEILRSFRDCGGLLPRLAARGSSRIGIVSSATERINCTLCVRESIGNNSYFLLLSFQRRAELQMQSGLRGVSIVQPNAHSMSFPDTPMIPPAENHHAGAAQDAGQHRPFRLDEPAAPTSSERLATAERGASPTSGHRRPVMLTQSPPNAGTDRLVQYSPAPPLSGQRAPSRHHRWFDIARIHVSDRL
jgi:hypothetical protein